MTNTQITPREGDIVRTKDGHLWRVTSVVTEPGGLDRPRHVAAISRLGDHIEMAAPCSDLTVVEAHPGGPR